MRRFGDLAAVLLVTGVSSHAFALVDGFDATMRQVRQGSSEMLSSLALELNTVDRFPPELVRTLADALEERRDSRALYAFALALRCAAYTRLREVSKAGRHCRDALAAAEASGGHGELYAVLRQVGRSQLEDGRIRAGVQTLLRALRHAEALNHPRAQSVVLSSLGGAAFYSFDLLNASEFLERAIDVARIDGDHLSVAGATNNLALVLFNQGRIREAREAYAQAQNALNRVSEFADTPIAAMVWFGEARCAAKLGDAEAAIKRMKEGFARFSALSDPIYLGVANRHAAEAYQAAGEHRLALKHVDLALSLFRGNNTRSNDARLLRAELLIALHRPEDALESLEPIIAGEEGTSTADALRLRAAMLHVLGDDKAAFQTLTSAYAAQERLELEQNRSRADFVRARFAADALARDNENLKQLALRDRRVMGLVAAVVSALLLLLLVLSRYKLRERQLENERERAYRLETIGRLTGGVAHDFNNMLQIIMHNVEYLASDERDEEALEVLNETRDAASAGAGIVEKLLTFARQSPHESTNVELDDFFVRVRPLLQRTVGDAVKLKIRTEAGIGRVRVDESKFTAALINLVANSRDAMGARGEILIAAQTIHRDRQKWVSVCVRDNGTGIDQEHQSRLFEPFFTTKPPGGGSGLGLSMVYGFIKESDGFVDLKSEPGVGTAISLMLPEAA